MDELKNLPPAVVSDDLSTIIQERDELRTKVKALSSLIDVGVIINSTLDLDDLIRLVMEKAQMVMEAEASSVMIVDEQRQVLKCPVALGEAGDKIEMIELQLGQGIAGWVALHGEPQIIRDAAADPRFNSKIDEETGFTTRSILAVPLKVKNRTIGVAEVINRLDGDPFCEDDLDLFLAFCRLVAMAIENARMVQLEMDKQRLDQQLEAAKFIQQSFMPDNIPIAPGRQFEVAAKSLAARSVGGDFYDFIQFDDDNIGVIVGDISGKGIPAALYMARMVSDFRLFTGSMNDPAGVLTVLNETLYSRRHRGMFVTCLYGILNAETGEFLFSNAGHLPVIHISQSSCQARIVESASGIPLGILGKYAYEAGCCSIEEGDYLVMITDGVTEARNPDGEEYSLERVLDLFCKPMVSADKMVEALLADVRDFSKNLIWRDDITVVAMKWH